MSRSARRDPVKVDTVILQQDTPIYTAVNRDGTIASRSEDAFGITMSSEDSGDPVRVCRYGLCPVRVQTAVNNNSEGTELLVKSNGVLDIAPSNSDVATPITAVDATGDIVSVAGDKTSVLEVGSNFDIINSTGNDGTYTVSAISYDGVNDKTDITTVEDIADATADGDIVTQETAFAIAESEGATSADGGRTGAWVDCLSLLRYRTIPASI